MNRGAWGRILTLGALAATLTIFLATELDARGRGGGGRGGGRSFSRGGPAAGGAVRANRPAPRNRGFSNRRGTGRDVRGNRRDVRRDVRGERREVRRDVRHEVREHHEWHEDRWKRRLGAALTMTAFAALSCQRTTVIVNGVAYTSCGGTWYNRAYTGGSVTYVIVNPPPGY